MKKVDRLIQKAKKKRGVEELSSALIRADTLGDGLIVTLDISNRKKFRTETIKCKTKEQADQIIDNYVEKYPPTKNVIVFFGEDELEN